jgi:hypothetical protein
MPEANVAPSPSRATPDTQPEPSADFAALAELCKNKDAAELIREVWNLVEVWDDAVDREHNEPEANVHRAFEFAMFGLPRNPFYMTNLATLEPALRLMVANCKCAVELERRADVLSLVHSYVLRCAPYDFFVLVVLVAAGPAAAEQAATRLRCDTTAVDPFDDYVAEHQRRKAGT